MHATLLRCLLLLALLLSTTGAALASDAPEDTAAASDDDREAQANDALARLDAVVKGLDAAIAAHDDPATRACLEDKRRLAKGSFELGQQSRYALMRAIERQKPAQRQQHLLDSVLLADRRAQEIQSELSACRGDRRQMAGTSDGLREGAEVQALSPRADAGAAQTRVFQEKRRSADRCHTMVSRSLGQQEGALEVAVDIDAGGAVSAVHITRSEVDPLLGQCVSDRIKRWRFPATATRATHRFEW